MREARATAQLLHRPPGTPAGIVRHLLAVQAQDERAMKLALRARGTGFTAADVDAALRAGELVVAWLFRSTLHLVAAEDHGWLLALTAPRQLRSNERRLAQLGVEPDRAAEIPPLLPATRTEIAAALGTSGQQTPHLLRRAALEGRCVRADGERWTAPPAPGAAGDLVRRYQAAHALAEPEDLARWSGLALGAVRDGWVAAVAPAPAPLGRRLLGMYDEYLLGFRDRTFAGGPEVPAFAGGVIRAVALEEGRAVATWSQAEPPPPGFEDELADVERFFRSG